MEYKKIGNAKIPIIGFGTWGIGGKFIANKLFKGQYIKIIHEAIKLGITHIDTSEIYGSGFTEEIIGEAISSFNRKKLFITSKLWHTHLNYKDALSSLSKSLKRLRTDYIDLYLIHWPSESMDLKGSMKALEHAHNQSLIKFIGVSNFNKQQIIEARQFLAEQKISAVQSEYNLLVRDQKVLDFCIKEKILFIAYKPLMRGKLAKPGIPLLDMLSKKYKKTQAQISLNWLVSKPQIVAIPKASKIEHLLDNISSIGWKMDKEDYMALDDMPHETI